jgi:hypothetical protein
MSWLLLAGETRLQRSKSTLWPTARMKPLQRYDLYVKNDRTIDYQIHDVPQGQFIRQPNKPYRI